MVSIFIYVAVVVGVWALVWVWAVSGSVEEDRKRGSELADRVEEIAKKVEENREDLGALRAEHDVLLSPPPRESECAVVVEVQKKTKKGRKTK